MKTLLSIAAISIASLSLSFAAPVNDSCPVSGKPVKASITSKHDGKTVAFCCDKCKAKFDADPSKYADKVD